MSNHFQHMLQEAFDKLVSSSGSILHSSALQNVLVPAHQLVKTHCVSLDSAIDQRDREKIQLAVKALPKAVETAGQRIAEFMKANRGSLKQMNGADPTSSAVSGISSFVNRLVFLAQDAPSAMHAVTVGTVVELVGKRVFELSEALDASSKSCKALLDKSAALHPITGKATQDLEECRQEAVKSVKAVETNAKELKGLRSLKTDLFHASQGVKTRVVQITASLKELEDAADRWLIQYDKDIKSSDTKPTDKHQKQIKSIEKVKSVAVKDKENFLEAAGIVVDLAKK